MDALEILIRDTLAEHAEQAPPMTGRVPRNAAATHGRSYALGAAAAVAVIAVGAVAIARHSAAGRDAGPAVSTPSTTHTTAPPGTEPVSFHGITLDVPRGLRIEAKSCSPAPVADAVIVGDPTVIDSCSLISTSPTARPVGGVEVSLTPLVVTAAGPGRTNVTVDGSPGYRHYFRVPARYTGITGGLTLADPGVEINVTAPTRAAVDRILDSVQLTPTDHLGCRARVASLTPTGNPPAKVLVPGHPISAVVCAYAIDAEATRISDSVTPLIWLFESVRLSTETTAHVARALASTAVQFGPGRIGSQSFPQSADWITFGYADGSSRTVAVANHEDPATVTDGNIHGQNDIAQQVAGLPN